MFWRSDGGSLNPDEMDVGAYILSEYIPAKPLVGNLELCFTGEQQVSTSRPLETPLISYFYRQPVKHVPN